MDKKALLSIVNKEDFKEKFDIDDEFFDFTEEEDREKINDMHYKDSEKVSAKEFMRQGNLNKEMVIELIKTYEKINYLIAKDFDEANIEELIEILNSLIKIFNLSLEFNNLAYSLEKLRSFIEKLNFDDKIVNALIYSILEDLKKWIKSVVIDQSAVDIHYLDASLLANINQFEILTKE